MRKKILPIIILLGLFLLPTALAANSQGLTWGVEAGQEIPYTLHIGLEYETTLTSTTMDETHQLIYTVQSLAAIPDTVDGTYGLAGASGAFSFENGSAPPSIPVSVPIAYLVIPIGNWSLIDEVFKESAEGTPSLDITWIDTMFEWGFTYTSTTMGNQTLTIRFAKSDGAANFISVSYDFGAAGSALVTFSRPGGPLDTTTLLIIGGGVAAVVVIGLVVWKIRS